LRGAAATEAGLSPTDTAEIPSLARVAAAFPQLEILELLGRGGMGFVFKARQPQLDRCVALKLLPDKLARDPHFAERFGREGRMLARLNHPGIVTIYDFGRAGGFYFLLMEYVDGVNLRQAMQAGKFSPAAALGVVPKICEALQYAHEQGVLHRDIKPANILLDARGRVKIADFGIAKLVGDEKPDLNLTATGAAIGTPQYMAPEQLEKPATVDHRADIYSLGVVFYEMLTGELPIGRFSPPSQRTPLDPRVDAVVMRTLEKEREKRFQSAGDVKTNVEHLTELGAGVFKGAPADRSPGGTVIIKPGEILPEVPWWRRPKVIQWALITLLVSGGAALLWPHLREPRQRPGSANAVVPLPEGQVELVALSREPSDGGWWRADGTLANEGPFEKYGASSPVGPGQRAVVFIFRSRDSERQEASRTYDLEGCKGWVSGGPPRLNGRPVSGGSFVTATFPESLRATTVRVGVAVEAWETLANDTGTATGTFNFSRHGQAQKVAFYGAIEDKSGDTIVTLTHDLPEADVRVLAVDDRGREHASTARHATGEKQRFTVPNLAPERVRQYRFQVRPYRWAEFKNVQLSPVSNVSVRAPLGHSAPATNAAPWIRFTFIAVELRELAGKRWLAIDYVDDVHGECQKAFPWETKIPGFQAQVRTSEFLKEDKDSPAVRHQRADYLMPDSMSRDQLENLRANVEKALLNKSVQLELGDQSDAAVKHFSVSAVPHTSPFAPTRWTLVLRAQGESAEGRAALSELCETYYQPVLRFLWREGRDEDAARELAHDFFARVLAGGAFAGADPERGRFRSYLLGGLKHFLTDQRAHAQRLKRGGGITPESLDAPTGTDASPGFQVADPAAMAHDAGFDREWALTVIDRALATLQKEFGEVGKAEQFETLKPWLMGDTPSSSQADAARQLGLSEGAVKVTIHRMRKRFRDVVRSEIAQTLRDPTLVEEELRHLIEALV
jgi:RNA polymerase sigma factor (sigma-70 family)